MTTFRRIKIQATVETAPMLLTEDQIDGALRRLREGLTQLDVQSFPSPNHLKSFFKSSFFSINLNFNAGSSFSLSI